MKKRISTICLVLVLSAFLLIGCSGSGPASEPSGQSSSVSSETGAASLPKNIEVQVPAKAGGGTDVMARTLAQEIASASGSNITIINNMDGAGVVAMETVRTAKGDGSGILQYHSSMLINSATGIYDKNVFDDFKIIGVSQGTEKAMFVLVTSADSGIDTLDKFIEYGLSNEVKMGVQTGGSMHIASGIIARETGIKAKYVEAGSDTEKLTALVGGTIDCCLVNVNQAKQYVESGKAYGIAVVTNGEEGAHSTILPDIKSFQDYGYDVVFTTMNIIAGPKDMSEEAALRLYDLYSAAASSDAVNEVLEPAGMAMEFYSYEEGPVKLKEQADIINALVEELGLGKQ